MKEKDTPYHTLQEKSEGHMGIAVFDREGLWHGFLPSFYTRDALYLFRASGEQGWARAGYVGVPWTGGGPADGPDMLLWKKEPGVWATTYFWADQPPFPRKSIWLAREDFEGWDGEPWRLVNPERFFSEENTGRLWHAKT